jgi:hypothetical protein
MSDRMQHALQENPNASIEDIMLQEGQAHKFIGNLKPLLRLSFKALLSLT